MTEIANIGPVPAICIPRVLARSPGVGFSGTISTKGLGSAGCPSLMRVIAADADGNTTVLGERRLLPK